VARFWAHPVYVNNNSSKSHSLRVVGSTVSVCISHCVKVVRRIVK